jgi:hypothetical protein
MVKKCLRSHILGRLFLFLVFSLVLNSVTTNAQTPEEKSDYLNYETSRVGNNYIFRGKIFVNASVSCVIQIIYDFKHLKHFLTSADSIDLVREGTNWYEARFTYHYLIFQNKIIYRRILKKEENRVTFEMVSCEQNSKLLPKILFSNGYYEISADKECAWVTYFEESTLEPSRFEWKVFFLETFVEKEAGRFLRELKKYTEATCQ